MLILAAALFSLSQAEPDRSGLADAYLVNVRDGSADIWLELDGQPSALSATGGDGALDLMLEGHACTPREIAPPAGRPVTRISVSAQGADGCRVRLEGQWREAEAFLGEEGVLVALDGVSIASATLQPVVSTASSAPARATAGAGTGGGQAAGNAPAAPATGSAGGEAAGRPTTLADAGGACAQSASRLEDTPWDLNVMATHADCLAGARRTGDAVTLYERVLAFEPGHYGAALGLARLRAAAGDRSAAAELFETAAESARTDSEALAARRAAEELESR